MLNTEDAVPATLTSTNTLMQNIVNLKAYCVAAHHKASLLETGSSTQSGLAGVLIHFVAKFGKVASNENILFSYAELLGAMRRSYDVGVSGYVLDHFSEAMQAGGVVNYGSYFISADDEPHDSDEGDTPGDAVTRILLDFRVLGFDDEPSYFHDMSVTIPEIQGASASLGQTAEETEAEAKLLCQDRADGASLLARMQIYYKAGAHSLTNSSVPASDTPGAPECASTKSLLEAILLEMDDAPGCPQLQGAYELGNIAMNDLEFKMTPLEMTGGISERDGK